MRGRTNSGMKPNWIKSLGSRCSSGWEEVVVAREEGGGNLAPKPIELFSNRDVIILSKPTLLVVVSLKKGHRSKKGRTNKAPLRMKRTFVVSTK